MEIDQKDASAEAGPSINGKSISMLLREDPISEENFSLLQYLLDADEGVKINVWGPILEGKLVEKDGWLQVITKVSFEGESASIMLHRVFVPQNIIPVVKDLIRRLLGASQVH